MINTANLSVKADQLQPVHVRPAADADRSAVEAILAGAFGAQAASQGDPDSRDRRLVVELDGAVVGTLRLDVDGDATGIYGFAIEPKLQGQGIGRTVLEVVCAQAMIGGARRVTLEVAVDNDHALGLYTSIGFERRATEDYFEVAVPSAPGVL